MTHRNRWFTELKNGGSFHGYVSHNQRVYPSISIVFSRSIESIVVPQPEGVLTQDKLLMTTQRPTFGP